MANVENIVITASAAGAYDLSLQTEVLNITGSGSADTIRSGSGNDSIAGGAGNDAVSAGSGADVVYMDGGSDTVDLGSDTDADIIEYTVTNSETTQSASNSSAYGSNTGYDIISNLDVTKDYINFNGMAFTGLRSAGLIQSATLNTNTAIYSTAGVLKVSDSAVDGSPAAIAAAIGSAFNLSTLADGEELIFAVKGSNGNYWYGLYRNAVVDDATVAAEYQILGYADDVSFMEPSTSPPLVTTSISESGISITSGASGTIKLGSTALSTSAIAGTVTAGETTTAATGVLTVTTSGNVVGTDTSGRTYSVGTSSADTFIGQYVWGWSGADAITGTSGADNLYGGDGNDTITGGGGADVISAGNDNDELRFTNGAQFAAVASVDGGSGTDTIQFTSASTDISSASFTNVASNSIEIIRLANGGNTVNLGTSSAVATTFLNAMAPNFIVYGGTGNDSVTYDFGTEAFTFYGGDGADVVDQSGGGVSSVGVADDYIDMGAGNDTAYAGAGNDTLIGGGGADYLDGELGDDLFVYATITDLFASSALIDSIIGNSGTDTVRIDQASTFTIASTDSFARAATIETLAVGVANSGDISLTLNANAFTAGIRTVTLAADTNTSGRNTINASAQTNTSIGLSLTGSSGEDVIIGGSGADNINSGAGIDTISYVSSSAGITVNLSLTTAQSGGAAAGDILSGFENLTGSAYADTLTGDSGVNIITGGVGADTLTGGAGADTFVRTRSDVGVDIIKDFVSGTDKFDIDGGALNFRIVEQAANNTIDLNQMDVATEGVKEFFGNFSGLNFSNASDVLAKIDQNGVYSILDSTSKCNFLKRVEVAETMVGSRLSFTWQLKKHDDLSPSQPRRTLPDFRLVERGAEPVSNCPESRAT